MEKPDNGEFRCIIKLERELMFSEYAIVADYLEAMAHYYHYSKRIYGRPLCYRKEREMREWAKKYRVYAREEMDNFIRQVCNG